MKIPPRSADRFIAAPQADIAAALLHGADRSLARERAADLVRGFGFDPNDPFALADLTEESLRADPACVADELRALSFTGGGRLVRITVGGDGVAGPILDAVQAIDSGTLEPAGRLMVTAGDLTTRSKLRKTFEAARRAAAVACPLDDETALDAMVDSVLADAGRAIEPDARAALLPCLEGGRAMARGELDKLLLYAHDDPGPITLEAVRAVGVAGDDADAEALVDASLSGDAAGADSGLQVLTRNPGAGVGIARAFQRRLLRVQAVQARHASTGDWRDALGGLRPPAFGPARDALRRTAERWPRDAVRTALERSVEAERRLKETGVVEAPVIGRLVMGLAQLGARANRRR